MERMRHYVEAIREKSVPHLKHGANSLRRHWLLYSVALLAVAVAAVAIGAAVSDAYDHRDVGSDSGLARLGGDGWKFQRGANPPSTDRFGEQVSSVRYLDQNWTPADSMRFYNVSQGSDLMPYDFFIALRKTGSNEYFRSDQNLNYYRYLTQKATVSNPDALPVGFVKDSYKGEDYIGFTCAACHTAQIDYKGIAIRIDGGPAMADMDGFLHELAPTVCGVDDPGPAHDRFYADVKALGHYSSADKISKDLSKSCQSLTLYNAINASSTAYGAGRLDAFGRIYNRVMEYILTKKELDDRVAGLTSRLTETGTYSPSQAKSIEDRSHRKLDEDPSREDTIDALAKLQQDGNTSALLRQLFIDPNAPVSYPFLWDIPQHDYVQWNGIAANAGLGPVGRNAGEVIGVFATLNWHEKDGFSLSALLSGQRPKGKHISFESSIKVHNLRLIERQLASLESPVWPKFFPAVDPAASQRGEVLFTQHCERCHARIQRDDPDRRVVGFFASLDDVKTDRQMATNAIASTGLSGILRDEYVSAGPGDVLIDQKAPTAALLTKATLSVVATPEDRNFLLRGYDWAYNLAAAKLNNDINPSLKQGSYTPDTTNAPYNSVTAYKGRSLNGIWATAPYLHNGSVPTLYDLLSPEQERPTTFMVGSREFDPDKVGLQTSGYAGFLFDTTKCGNSNKGHNYPAEGLTPAQRDDLLQYLKTL